MTLAPNAEMWTTLRMQHVVQGEFRVSKDPAIAMSTILGSCVSVALFDDAAGVGGINHFLLPASGERGNTELRYGAMANELLINELLKLGASRSHIRAKLFGGANVVARLGDVGSRNVSFARDYMRREGIPVEELDVGGTQARRLQFHPTSGKSRVFKVPVDQERAVVANESPRSVMHSAADVTLF